jgi:hypothetical protein
MFRRYWITAIAFGLALIFSPPNEGQEGKQEPPADPTPSHEQPAQQPAEETEAGRTENFGVSPTNHSSREHYRYDASDGDEQHGESQGTSFSRGILGDGWAQWAMAIVSLLALGVSAWAVALLKKTLTATRAAVKEAEIATKAAQDSVRVTSRIGQAQSRGYLTAKEARFSSDLEHAACQICVENTGQSPAEVVRITGTIKVHEVGSGGGSDIGARYELQTADDFPRLSVSGRSQANTAIFWSAKKQPKFADAMNIIRGGKPFFVDVTVTYVDVFEERHEIKFRVTTLNDDSVYGGFEKKADHKAGVGVRGHAYKQIEKNKQSQS